jgi:hypothetical protein
MPIISGSSGGGGAVTAAAIEATFTAAGQVYQGTGSGTGALVLPPGFEINYTQITASVNITDTSEATATALISPGVVTFDGGAVLVEVFAYTLTGPTSGFVSLTLFEGATEITRLAVFQGFVTGAQVNETVMAHYRFTPSVGSHTYKVCGFVASTAGTPVLVAGSGGPAGNAPSYIRFTKV